jgi:ComF family protein
MTCRERDFQFEKNISIYEYRTTAAALIARYKFQGCRYLAQWFSKQFYGKLRAEERPYCIVPVPGNPRSVRKRGWDQIREIVGILERRYGIPAAYLLRRKPSRQQKSLGYRQRCENLRGRIRVYRSGAEAFRKKLPSRETIPHIILIDDVFTTGATVNECAGVLRRCGFGDGGISVITAAID